MTLTHQITSRRLGVRLLSPAAHQGIERLERYTGLPCQCERHTHLLTTAKQAAVELGVTEKPLRMLELLFLFTQEQDWQEDSRPIVWPSNRYLADELGITPRQVANIIRRFG